MLGFYPPGQNNYQITEEQKYNAVPPIDNFDFKPWIDEMGTEALPHNATIFPIQMNGWNYDYMLALDNDNCASRNIARASKAADFKTNAATIAGPKLTAMFESKGGYEVVCNYINWAYTESITLNDQFKTDSGLTLEDSFAKCQDVQKAIA